MKKKILIGVLSMLPLTAVADHSEWHKDVKVGALSEKAVYGQAVFNSNCAQCHGENGSGTLQGPPLIHDIYNPGHHGNNSFISAMRNGVQRHHWPYGDMPSQPQVGFMQATAILVFVREVQAMNGIVKKERHM